MNMVNVVLLLFRRLNKCFLVLSFFTFVAISSVFSQATSFYVSSGNWSSPANWTAGVPTATSVVSISDGAVCTLDVPGAQCASLTFGSNSLNASLTFAAGASLTVTGAVNFSAPSVDGANQTIAVGTGALSCGSINFADCANGGLRTNKLTVLTGSVSSTGSIVFAGANNENYLTFTGAGALNIGGNFTGSGSFGASSSTVTYTGANQTINPTTYYNLNFANAGTKTLAGACSVGGNLTVNAAGTVVLGGAANTTSVSGNVLVTNLSTLTLGDAVSVKTLNVSGNLQVDNGSSLNVGAFAATHQISLSGNLIDDGTIDLNRVAGSQTATVTIFGSMASIISGTAIPKFANLTINNAAGVVCSTPNAWVAGTLTLTAGVFDIQNNEITFHTSNTPLARTAGTLQTGAAGTITFGITGYLGGNAFTVPNSIFATSPLNVGSLVVNRTNALTLGNQDLAVTSSVNLIAGVLNLNGRTLTLTGATPFIRSAGTLTATAGSLVFGANATAATLPDNLFTTSPMAFTNLTLNRAGGLILNNQEMSVTGTTTLTSGVLALAGADLQVATIGGIPSASAMVVCGGAGFLKRSFATGVSSFTFPLGDLDGIQEYSPMTLSFSANTVAGVVSVKALNVKHPQNTQTDNYLNRYWTIKAPTLTNYTYTTTVAYPAADVVGADESNFRLTRYNQGTTAWTSDNASTANSTTHVISSGTLTQATGSLHLNDVTAYGGDVYYWSKATGNWNGATTWEVTSSPIDPGVGSGTATTLAPSWNNNKGITIRTGHVVTNNAATFTASRLNILGTLALGANSLTLYDASSADLTLASGGVLSTTGGQLIAASLGVDIVVNGLFQTADADGFSGSALTSIANTNSPTVTLSSGSIVEYSLAGVQTVTNAISYSGLKLSGGNTKNFAGAISIAENLVVTGANTNIVSSSQIDVLGNMTLQSAGTCVFGGSASLLNVSGSLNVTSTSTLTIGNTASQNKTINVGGNVVVDASSSILAAAVAATGSLSIGGILSNAGTFNMWRAAGQVCNVTITPNTAMSLTANSTFNALTFADVAVPIVISQNAAVAIKANLSIGNNIKYVLTGASLIESGNILVSSGGEMNVLSSASASAQITMSNTKNIDNAGVLKIIGSAAYPAIVTGSAANYYYITQTAAAAQFHALYSQFNYLDGTNGGLKITAGSIDNTNNLSYSSFSNGNGVQYVNITGLDVSNVTNPVNGVSFNAGPTSNVARISGTGTITFEDAQGALAGENFDVDNANPGTLVAWSNPTNTFYSQGTGLFSSLSNWNKNPLGGGASPIAADLTSGMATFIIMDDDIITQDQDVDIYKLQIGTTSTGILTVGNNSTVRTLTVESDLVVKAGATLNNAAYDAIQNIVIKGNLSNDGVIDLFTTSVRQAKTTFSGNNCQVQGAVAPIFGDFSVAAAKKVTANLGLNIDGSVSIAAGATFDAGAYTHTLAGNWTCSGTHTSTGTIEFDGLGVSDITTGATFYNVTLKNPVARIVGTPVYVNNDFAVINGCTAIATGTVNVYVRGDMLTDVTSTYTQTAGAIVFDGSAAQLLNLQGSTPAVFNQIIFRNGGTNSKTINGNIVNASITLGNTSPTSITIESTATVDGAGSVSLSGGLRIDGTCNLSGRIELLGGTLLTGNASNSLTLGTAQLVVNSGYVYLGYTAPATACTVNVSNDVQVNSGRFYLVNNTFLNGNSGVFSVSAGTNLYVQGNDNFPTGFTTYSFASNSNTVYDANMNQTVRGGSNLSYGNLYLRDNALFTKTADGDVDVNGVLDLGGGGAGWVATNFATTYNVTLVGNLANNNNSSIVQTGTGVFSLDGDNSQSIANGTYQFANLDFTTNLLLSAVTKTCAIATPITVLGNITASNLGGDAGKLLYVNLGITSFIGGASGIFSVGANTEIQTQATVGALSFQATVLNNFASILLDDASTIHYNNTISNQELAPIATPYGNVYLTGSTQKIASGAMNIDGMFRAVANTPVFYDGGFTHSVAKDWLLGISNYTQLSATGTIVFDGADQQIFNTNFNNVQFAGSGTKALFGNLNNVYGSLTINDGATFDAGIYNITLWGNWINAGSGVFNHGTTANSWLTFVGLANQTVENNTGYFNHITINKPRPVGNQTVSFLTNVTVNGNFVLKPGAGVADLSNVITHLGGNLTVDSNVVETGRTFISDGGTIIFDGDATQTIWNRNTNPITFNNIQFSGSGDKIFEWYNGIITSLPIGTPSSRLVDITGSVIINSSLVTGNGWVNGYGGVDFTVAGDWTNAGNFVHSAARTLTFDGANQQISGSSFGSLVFAGTDTKTLTGDITALGSLIINANSTLDVGANKNISLGLHWLNNGSFLAQQGTVTFVGGSNDITTGALGFPQPNNGFYNVVLNKNAGNYSRLMGVSSDFVVANDFTISTGYFQTNAFDVWIGGNFTNTSTSAFSHNNVNSLITFNAQLGNKTITPGLGTYGFVEFATAPSVTTSLLGTFSASQDMTITSGNLDLNSQILSLSGTNTDLFLNGGSLSIDSAAVLTFASNNQRLINAGGALQLVGTANAPAKITRSGGSFIVTQTSGSFAARNYAIDQTNGVTISGGTIDAVNNFSDGAINPGASNMTCVNFDNFPIDNTTNLKIKNLFFNNGAYTTVKNVKRQTPAASPNNGYVELQDAGGNISGATYEVDDAGAATGNVRWTQPNGYYWVGLDATDNTDWNRAANWAGGVVPDTSAKVYLNHNYVAGAYTVNIQNNKALAKRLIMSNLPAGGIITLVLKNSKSLAVTEDMSIGASTVVTVTNNTDTIYVGKNWSNAGTFNHGSSTVIFNGVAGLYSIASGGTTAGKSFYKFEINSPGSVYSLSQNIDIDNNISIFAGTLSANNYDMLVGGNWTNTSGGIFIPTTRTVTFDGANQTIIGGPFYHVTTAGSGIKTAGDNLDINGTVTIAAATILDGQDKTLYVAGNWLNNGGSFEQTGVGLVNFDAIGGTQLIDNGAATTNFNNLTFSNAGSKTFYKNTNVEGDLFISSSSTGNVNVQTYTITGVGGNNTLFNYGNLVIQGANNFPAAFENINMSANSYVIYQADIAQTVYSTTYGNLRLRRLAAGTTTKTAADDLTITGSLYLDNDAQTTLDMQTYDADIVLSNTISIVAGSKIVWGTGNSTLYHIGNEWSIPANLGTVNNFVLQGTNNKWMNGDIVATGNVTVQNGVTLYMCGWYNGALYHTLKCTGVGKMFTIQDGGVLRNYTPSSVDVAFPSGFAMYNLADNSTVYLGSPQGLSQTLLSAPNYGNLSFYNLKNVSSDGLFDLHCDGNFDAGNSTYFDGGKDMYLAGASNYLSFYTPSSSAQKLVLSGANQFLYDSYGSTIDLGSVVFNNSGIKTFGDNSDVITISGTLSVASGVSVACNRDILFTGTSWYDEGTFVHSGGTITFNNNNPVSITPGQVGATFNAMAFTGTGAKTFATRGADINGSISLTAGSVDFGALTHSFAGNITNTGGTYISSSASFLFDGNAQTIQTTFPSSTFTAKDITLSTTSGGFVTKLMSEHWNIQNLTIGTLNNLDASVSNYNITVGGNWDNAGNFIGRAGKVSFISPTDITINNPTNGASANGGYNFYDVDFGNGSSTTNFTLTANSTQIRRASNILAGASLNLNSNTLILGSNIASGKNYSVAGTLNVNENAFLKFDNQSSPCVMDVTGTLNILGLNSTNLATITRLTTGGQQINITTGTIAARYYLIEYLANTGLNVQTTATLDAINNFSDGTWANINNVAGVCYMQLNASNYSGGVIKNVAMNSSFAPAVGVHYNVKRTTATPVITFDEVLSGNLADYHFEGDDNSATTGSLRWPGVTSVTWTGAVSNEWENPNNWLPNTVPTTGITANIPSVTRNPVISTADAFCKNLNITNGSLTLSGGYNITVNGDVTIGTATNTAILAVTSSFCEIFVNGNWTRGTNGIFTHGNATVHFESNNGTATITPRSSAFYNIEINNPNTVFYFAGNLAIKGSLILTEGTLTPTTTNYVINLDGNYNNVNGLFTTNVVGVLSLTGSNQDVTNGSFYRLRVKGTGVKTIYNNLSVRDTLTISSTLKVSTGSVVDMNGDVAIDATGVFDDGGETHTFSGARWIGAGLYQGSGTIVFDGSRNQSFGPAKFNNLMINNTAGFTTTLLDNVSIIGDFTIKSTAQNFNCATYQITNTSGTGTFTLEASKVLFVRGLNNFPVQFAVYQLDPSSQVRYDGLLNQTVFGNITYGRLYLYYNTIKTLGGDISLAGNLEINNATFDVSTSNYGISIAGNWYNNQLISGITGTFIPQQGTVSFNGAANQYIYLYGSATVNPFYKLTVDKTAGILYAPSGVDNIIKNSLILYVGSYSANGRISFVGADLLAISGSFTNSGTYYLNNTGDTVSIQMNGSVIPKLVINAPTATYEQLDNIEVGGNFDFIAGTLQANGMTNYFGTNSSHFANIGGTYIAGAGGFIRMGYYSNLLVVAGGVLDLVGASGNLVTVTQGRNTGRYSFQIDGTIRSKYSQFEYMDALGVNVTTNGYVDPLNNFSYSTFTSGAGNGTYLKIENNQDLFTVDSIIDVSFPVALTGVCSNVTKTVASGKVKFYNAVGSFAGENFDQDDNNRIEWRGPVTLTWNGSVSSDWFNTLNWTASNGQLGLIPTPKNNVIIAPTVTQPIIDFSSNLATADTLPATKNLTIKSGAVLKLATATDSLDLLVGGDFKIDGQLIMASTSDSIAVAGNWLKSATGSVTCNGSVVFTGVNNVKTINNGSFSFNNLYIQGNTTFQLGANTIVRNNLVINSGVLNASASNYNLTVGGNWINNGSFLSYNGQVILNSTTGAKQILAGSSPFNILTINAPAVTYSLTSNMTAYSAINIQNGTLDLNSKTVVFGDNLGSDVINVFGGTLEVDAGAVLKMGTNSSLSINAPGTLKLVGAVGNDATITNQAAAKYNISINSGTISAKYYTIDNIGANGLWIKGAQIDPANNLSNGTFTNGTAGGTYLRFDNNFVTAVDADTIRNLSFGAGASTNVTRSPGYAAWVVIKDATGVLASYLYENDNAAPYTGSVRWAYTNPVISWTGAVSTQWSDPMNWAPPLPPDSTIMAEIRPVAGFPCTIDNTTGDASIKKLSIFAGGLLNQNDGKNLLIDGDLTNAGTYTVTAASRITTRGQWSNTGSFVPGTSTVAMAATSGIKSIVPGASLFNNLEIAGAATFRLSAATKVLGNVSILAGVLDVSANNYSLTVGGNFTNQASFLPRLGTVILNGATTQTITNPLGTFYNLSKPATAGAGAVLFGSNIDVDNDFTMQKGTFNGQAYTLNLGGNWAFAGATVTASNISLIMDGTISKTISSAAALSFNNFTVLKPVGKEVIANTNYAVTGTFKLQQGNLNISGKSLTLSGTAAAGSGTITATSSSTVTVTGTGAFGALAFTPSYRNVRDLIINRPAGSVSLASPVTVNRYLTLTNGLLTLNGNALSLANNPLPNLITITNGSLSAAPSFGAAVDVLYNGTLPVVTSYEIPASATALRNLTVNSTGGVSLSTNVTANGSVTFASGAMALNAKTLTIKGSLVTTSGTISGDAAANIVINGSSTLGGSLNFTPSYQTLNTLTLNRTPSGAATIGTDLTLNSVALTNGELTIGANTNLTINNAITYTNGVFSGTPTSTLTLNGALASSIKFGAVKQLGSLDINRAGTTVLNSALTIYSNLYLRQGILNNSNGIYPLSLAANASIHRYVGALSAVPTFGTSLNVLYLGAGAISTSFEMPIAASILKNLTINRTATVTATAAITVNGTLNLTAGYLNCKTNNKTLTMTSASNVVPAQGSSLSFVIGKIFKYGNTAFYFPLGDMTASDTVWAPIKMSAPNLVTDVFDAIYNYSSIDTDLGIRTDRNMSPGISTVSEREYWLFNRGLTTTSTPALTLTWKDAKHHSITNLPDLTVGHWDASVTRWLKQETGSTAVGTLDSGYITTNIPFASYCPVDLATVAGVNPLPIELLSFTAQVVNKKVVLDWKTASERNTSHYLVQRSVDGKTFVTVDSLAASGMSYQMQAYNAIDVNPVAGYSYYRLQSFDLDGSFTFSPVVSVLIEQQKDATDVSVYPTLVSSLSDITVVARNYQANQLIDIQISNTIGEMITSLRVRTNEVGSFIDKPFGLLQLNAGIYLIQIISNNEIHTMRIVIE